MNTNVGHLISLQAIGSNDVNLGKPILQWLKNVQNISEHKEAVAYSLNYLIDVKNKDIPIETLIPVLNGWKTEHGPTFAFERYKRRRTK